MLTIWKYNLRKSTFIELPINSKLLKVGVQNEDITLWFQVNPNYALTTREFKVIGTGWEIPQELTLKYLDSVFTGPFVWHVYEVL